MSVATTGSEQTYLAARHNWSFRDRFPRADHLFNGFDYGHAIVYENLVVHGMDSARIDGPTFDFVTTRVLRHPPAVPLEEAAIGPDYAKLVPEVVAMFEWAHGLHRQLYDVWGAYGLTDDQRDAEAARVIRYYRSRRDLAFSARPKSMTLMEGQAYSLAFRRGVPKYNGLLWSYHWLQMAIYDALLTGKTEQVLQKSVDSLVDRFFGMIADAPRHMPDEMPMAPEAAPLFSARYPDAAIIFDNLHSLHDVVSDILASPIVPAREKRAAILRAAAAYRDDTTAVISLDEWRMMGMMHHGGDTQRK
ncbi:MAG TPA: hypothetical protein VH277_05695 [Gemmatimonadaceae bacterium]|jgi:hypothetical protein|nr:hypothetical protein [Gemmatimonadaceae bacterium]